MGAKLRLVFTQVNALENLLMVLIAFGIRSAYVPNVEELEYLDRQGVRLNDLE